jgi:SAM-dependent methyltransferase
MASYEKLSRFYDPVMGDRADTASYVRDLIVRNKPAAKTLLELGCGTGAVLKILARSYDVVGLDLSPQMLAIARKKLPGANLVHGDMVNFDLHEKFDVIICVFDSINHVLRFADWKQVFRRAALHLEKGGLFLFDINTVEKLQRRIRMPPWTTAFGKNSLMTHVTDEGNGIANWNLKVYAHQAGGECRVFEENIQEISFPVKTIKSALRERFAAVQVLDPDGGKPSRRSDRLYFLCTR